MLIFATGGNAGDRLMAELQQSPIPAPLPNPYAWLAELIPALGTVREPVWIGTTPYFGLAPLAGLGAVRALDAAIAQKGTKIVLILRDTVRSAYQLSGDSGSD